MTALGWLSLIGKMERLFDHPPASCLTCSGNQMFRTSRYQFVRRVYLSHEHLDTVYWIKSGMT